MAYLLPPELSLLDASESRDPVTAARAVTSTTPALLLLARNSRSVTALGPADVAATMCWMTLQPQEYEVGVRDLHDRLSEHLERVERGVTLVVTRRGRRIARLSSTDLEDPLEDLVRRGLITAPKRGRSPRRARVKATGSVSDLVGDQRR